MRVSVRYGVHMSLWDAYIYIDIYIHANIHLIYYICYLNQTHVSWQLWCDESSHPLYWSFQSVRMGEFPSLYLVENLDQNPTNEVPIVCSLGQIAYNQEFTPSKTNLKAWWKNDLYFIPESGLKNVKKHEKREKTWGNMKKTRKNMKNMKTRAICFRQSINVYAVKKREKTWKNREMYL